MTSHGCALAYQTIRRAGHSLEHADTNYLAAISDLLLGLIFLFILLLVGLAFQYKIDVEYLNAQKKVLEREKERLTGALRARKEFLELVRDELNARNPSGGKAEIDTERGILRLPEGMLFDTGSAMLSPAAQDTIAVLAHSLASHLPCYVATSPPQALECRDKASVELDTIFIEGHTDRVPINTVAFRDNWALSLERAKTTYDALLSKQSVLRDFRNDKNERLFTFSAYADTRPRTDVGNDLASLRQNRRIDIRFFVSTPKP